MRHLRRTRYSLPSALLAAFFLFACGGDGSGPVTAASMSALGGTGIRELARLNYDKSEYLKAALRDAGFSIPFGKPTFNEFVVDFGAGFGKIHDRLAADKIIAGLPLECYYPELANHYLLCVTETIGRNDMDELVKKLNSNK